MLARYACTDAARFAVLYGALTMQDTTTTHDTTPAPAYALGIPAALARSAFQGTSWTPEARGMRTVQAYESEIAQDIEHLRKHATKGGTLDQLDAEVARYAAGYRSRLVAWLGSESRCVSSWIAGPSNFPARRMQKRADVAHRRMGEVVNYRAHALAAAVRRLRPDLRPIMASDADACEQLRLKINAAEALQARMRAANAAIRKHAKAGAEAQVFALAALGFRESVARELLKPDFAGRIGFADYELTNNGANIRRMRQRMESIARNQAAPVQEVECANGVRLEDDPPANRVRLYFPGKPDQATRDTLKARGFRWAPSAGAWQAYRNAWSLQTAREFAPAAAA